MKIKLVPTLALSAILSLTISQHVNAMEEVQDRIASRVSSRDGESENWEKMKQTKVPLGRAQLQIYKEIYNKHLAQRGKSLDVEGLEEPFFWLYKNAYERLAELEKENSLFKEKFAQTPTEALRNLFNKHYNELLKQNNIDLSHEHMIHLSIGDFETKVMDVLSLLDLCFHKDCQSLLKENLIKILEGETKKSPGNLLFSPVFLKRQGLSVESMNYAYFGNGPFLAACEVGPALNAHSRLYSESNYKFMRQHDLKHAETTLKYLQKSKPQLFEMFQKLHAKMETLAVDDASRDLLQLGLFFSGHEYVQYLENRSDSRQLRDEIKYIFGKMIANIKGSLNAPKFDDHNHKVFYKDAMDGMESLVKKHFSDEYDEMVVLMKKRTHVNAEQLVALALFNTKFFELTDDILFEVVNGRPHRAEDIVVFDL